MGDEQCPICFEAITPATGHAMLPCSHRFHFHCVARTFWTQSTDPSHCPMCRSAMPAICDILWADDESESEEGESEESPTPPPEGPLPPAPPLEPLDLYIVWRRVGAEAWEREVRQTQPIVWDGQRTATPPPYSLSAVTTHAATLLQALWRGYRVRRHTQSQPTEFP